MTVQSFFIETFGCQMNLHDSEKIAGLLAQRGMVEVGSAEEADLFLLNTCSVREKAAQILEKRQIPLWRHTTYVGMLNSSFKSYFLSLLLAEREACGRNIV